MRNRGLSWRHLLRPFLPHFILVLAACRPASPTPPAPPVTIALTAGGDSISIAGTNVSRAAILRELRVRHQIEVRAAAVPDELISPKIERVPLYDAIRQLLPADAHFGVRWPERDLDPTGGRLSKGDKRGSREVRSDTLVTKEKARRLPADQWKDAKIKPDTIYRPARMEPGPMVKRPAEELMRVPNGKGPKAERLYAPADTSLRLTFTIVAPNTVRLVRAQRVPGSTPATGNVEGPFLFAIRDQNGALIHFGALLDPLELHSYLPDSTHTEGRATEGTFGLWIPAELVRRVSAGPITIEFFDARTVALPTRLDEKTFERYAREAKAVAKLSGASLERLIEARGNQ